MNTQNTAQAENKDFLTESLTKAVRFCKQNRKPVIIGLVTVVLVIVGVSLYVSHVKQVAEDSWAAYYNAQLTLATQGEEAGFAQLDKLAAEFKGTPAAEYAKLFKGDVLYSHENFAQAANVYKEVTSSKNETARTLATLSQAAALQAAQDYNASVEVMSSFIAHNAKSFALPQAYLTLAMSQELAGQKAAALASYKYLLENYTKTYFGTLAKDKISQLEK